MSRKQHSPKPAQTLNPAIEAAHRDLNGLKQCIQMQLALLKDLEQRLKSLDKARVTNSVVVTDQSNAATASVTS